ncbi:hypothetical protein [Telmatospirillum siberiense]|uniref:Uncharacterized protein n=1 Tax=Telmatospirillum siberiense TaxID=382514 RepID=A0A2N3Q1C5_9PROT|nr:hypothetical protein [Telmatospirillum siberiense]PKU26456.1 hypothetical protein CWS72_01010 [Telmatospirillum siberiense]
MKALKALVIGMGMLIVVGLGLLGFGLYRNTLHPAQAKAGAGEGAGPYFSVELPVASGSHLEQMAVAGDRVILRFSGGEGERILVLDPQTGHLAGTVSLVPQKP